MGRPKVPLIDRDAVIDTALALIDRDGLAAFSIRKLGQELGVNAASLYHHFDDKEAILQGVRVQIMHESQFGETTDDDDTWQAYVAGTTSRYRAALLRHPHAAPLLAPNVLLRPYSLAVRERVAARLLAEGVAVAHVHPIIDSLEMLAYSSASLNPDQLPPSARLPIAPADRAPALRQAVRAAPKTADAVFARQLRALVDGWTAVVARG